MFIYNGFSSFFFFFSSRRRHTRFKCDWSSDVCSSDLYINDPHVGIEVHTWQPFHLTGNTVDGCPSNISASPEVLNDILVRFAPRPSEIGRASCRERV